MTAKPRVGGNNPYRGYDSAARPFLYNGENPPHGIDPLSRVVRVGQRAWPMERLRQAGRISEAGVVITWEAGQASALDTSEIGKGRDVAHDVMFAFAYHAFFPDGRWMGARRNMGLCMTRAEQTNEGSACRGTGRRCPVVPPRGTLCEVVRLGGSGQQGLNPGSGVAYRGADR